MRLRCEYCDSWIDDTDEVCPHCGAPNAHMMVSGTGEPKTIEELKAFAERHNLPLKDMRFFIGEDYREPRAFGIYQDGEDFVVYKNKANGERAVRYRGHDEAYAVNELYQKMKSEVATQKKHLAAQKSLEADKMWEKARRRQDISLKAIIFALVLTLVVLLGSCVYTVLTSPYAGYYTYEDTTYFHNDSGWYYFDTSDSNWVKDDAPPVDLTENSGDYYTTYDWDSDLGVTDFSDSPYQPTQDDYSSGTDTHDWDSDWDDDDWDWDSSDSWDSGLTDWDSDW